MLSQNGPWSSLPRTRLALPLKAADAAHLATAVVMDADRFITNNRRDFLAPMTDVQVTYPPDPADPVREVEAAFRAMGHVPAVPVAGARQVP